MYVYLALLIPIIAVYISYKIKPHEISLYEIFLPLLLVILVIIPFKLLVDKAQTDDIEYLSNPIKKAVKYEPYTTWVQKQCRRTYTTGSGKHRTRHTVYYDCSYCDEHPVKYVLQDDRENEYQITESYYNNLVREWNSNVFVELNRNIKYHNGIFSSDCGNDGDAYVSFWNNKPLTAVNVVKEHTYENRIHAAHTVFEYKKLSDIEIKNSGVYEYPEIKDFDQDMILGQDKFRWYSSQEKTRDERLSSYIDGKFGPLKQCKVFVLLFKNKPINSAFLQESHWEGGNKNEFVLCIGIDSLNRELQWVKSFGWSTNKRVHVDAREEIMNQKYYDFYKIYNSLDNVILPNFKRKEFTDFNYITVEPPFWSIITIFILSIIISLGTCYWILNNDIN